MNATMSINNKKKRILIVSRDISLKQDGGTLVSKRNERLLRQLGFDTERFMVPIPSMFTRLSNIVLNQSYGETSRLKNKYIHKLKECYDYIFFDGSAYGGFLEIAAKKRIKTICFYHNVEVDYYSQKAIQSGSVADRIMIPYIRYNEKKSTRLASRIITLNKRDSDGLNNHYGRQADIILPTSFPSRNIKDLYAKSLSINENPYLLFVGTNFFANIEGLDRFIKSIAPFIDTKIVIVGNIKEAFRNATGIPANIEFKGKVDSLAEYYINASAVIAPIYTGSGLKTKTAEALSYAKTVIGFPEAFQGIELKNYPGSCIQVNSDKEFIQAIDYLDMTQRYNRISEKLFIERLSDESQLHELRKLFQ